MSNYCLICCVVNMGDGHKTVKCARKYGIKGGTISIGRGTVHSHLLEMLGLDEVRKEVLTMVVERELASEALQGIGRELAFHKPNHGIAFTMPVVEFTGARNQVQHDADTDEGEDSMYKAIYVIVDRGRAEEVIHAAKGAGARGATVMNARGSGIHETQKLFEMEIMPEKEEVLIIATSEQKDEIAQAITSALGIDKPGNGVLFVMDVNEAYGLY